MLKRKIEEKLDKWIQGSKKALIVTAEAEPKVYRSANNIPGVKTATVGTLNVYDILNGGKFIAPKNAIAKIEEVYA